MSQKIPLYIPTFINSAAYAPARVLPRLYYYNGQVDCETWYIADATNTARAQTAFPYFDHYNVVTGTFPTSDSDSLLFNNEAPSYGQMPTDSLYTKYWEKYISFLYNPKTRLLNCSAIIPLADYFDIELNDIVNFRGNYYHLRAINDYNLKTGNCTLQLLGPIIADALSGPPEPIIQASSSVSWSYTESAQDGTFTVFDNATTIATLTANGSGNTQISESHIVNATLSPVGYPSSGSVTMSINVNGGTTLAVVSSANTTISASFTVGSAQKYGITGSIIYNAPLSIDYLIVAGGGGGGARQGGGGGAGGYMSGSFALTTATPYTLTIGAGGAAATTAINPGSAGTSGSQSSISTLSLSATGGGAGGGGAISASNGGSGGGSSLNVYWGSGSVGQGNDGNYGITTGTPGSNGYSGGGGGGASQTGSFATGTTQADVTGGNGGNGKAWLDGNIYAGGGGGGTNPGGYSGTGGTGGGGSGSVGNTKAQNATANTGGGGGGYGGTINDSTAGTGGSGIIKLRYLNTLSASISVGLTSSTLTTGSFKITTFTAGTGTVSFS
jgi:hypothetical protein